MSYDPCIGDVICEFCGLKYNLACGPGPHRAECVDKLVMDRAVLLAALRDVDERIYSRAHDCAGFDCAVCGLSDIHDRIRGVFEKLGREL